MREKILDVAEELVQSRSLDSVTFQEIADIVGLRKPSLFHHVKNKKELTGLLIERCSTKHGPLYEQVIQKDTPAPKKLKELARIFEDGLIQGRPCLLAAIGRSQQSLSTATSKKLARAADDAIQRVSKVFEQGKKEGTLGFKGKPGHAAMCFLALLQGLQSLCQLTGDIESFRKSVTMYVEALDSSK